MPSERTEADPLTLLSPDTRDVVMHGGRGAERLLEAVRGTLRRELAMLGDARRADDIREGLQPVLHMLRGQATLFDLAAFSPATRNTLARALAAHRLHELPDGFADDLDAALTELLARFDPQGAVRAQGMAEQEHVPGGDAGDGVGSVQPGARR